MRYIKERFTRALKHLRIPKFALPYETISSLKFTFTKHCYIILCAKQHTKPFSLNFSISDRIPELVSPPVCTKQAHEKYQGICLLLQEEVPSVPYLHSDRKFVRLRKFSLLSPRFCCGWWWGKQIPSISTKQKDSPTN